MSWIQTIPFKEATGPLKKIYKRLQGPQGSIDNVLTVHGLRPHTLVGHMGLYKSVLHHSGNSLPKWYLETLGVYTSFLNQCNYCYEHHFAGLSKLLEQKGKAEAIKAAIALDNLDTVLETKWLAGAQYAKQLTEEAYGIREVAIEELRIAGFSDGEILEINQVVSYFNYVNRCVLGLGVNTKGDVLGLSPNNNEDPNNWSHT